MRLVLIRGLKGVSKVSYGRALLVVLAMCMLALFSWSAAASADTAYDAEELKFLDLINDYRQDNGLGALILSDDLTVSSDKHDQDMAEYDFFAHDTVQSSYYPEGSKPWDRMAAEGYDYNTFKGENLAAGYESAEEAFQAWRESPSHNEAMLDGNYKVVGIARYSDPGSAFGWYWATDFGAYVDPSSHEPGQRPQDDEEAAKPPKTPEKSPETGENTSEKQDAVKNGSFEDRSAWKERARDGAKLILRGQFVRLGGYKNGVDELSQRVRIGEGAKLRYGIRISTSKENPSDDALRVRLTNKDGERVGVLKSYTGEDAGKWRREEVEVPEKYAGKTLYLSFFVRTWDEKDTRFYLDNVSLVS